LLLLIACGLFSYPRRIDALRQCFCEFRLRHYKPFSVNATRENPAAGIFTFGLVTCYTQGFVNGE
jgi:hypothetical protein